MNDTITRAVGRRNVPEDIRALEAAPDADYVDVFTLATDAVATPERWARLMFGNVPSAAERFIWRGLLDLRLSRGRSADTVAGWRIVRRGDDLVQLETRSWFLTATLLVTTTDGHATLSTFLRYDRRLGALVWPPLSAVHRSLVPGLLRGAAARIASGGSR